MVKKRSKDVNENNDHMLGLRKPRNSTPGCKMSLEVTVVSAKVSHLKLPSKSKEIISRFTS